MNENKKGYWIYSILTVLFFVVLFGFSAYLIYDLIVKIISKDFSTNTVVQAIFTLFITVFLGGYFTKWLERRNARKLETYKTQKDIAIKIIDLSTMYLYNPDNEDIRHLLIAEESKVKLFFNDEVLSVMNAFLTDTPTKDNYQQLVETIQKVLK